MVEDARYTNWKNANAPFQDAIRKAEAKAEWLRYHQPFSPDEGQWSSRWYILHGALSRARLAGYTRSFRPVVPLP